MARKRAFKQAFAYLYIAFEANALLVGAYIIAAIGVVELLAPVSHLFEFPLTVRLGNDRLSRVLPFATLDPFRLKVADGESSPRPVLVEYGFENRGFGKSSHEIPIMTKCTGNAI